MASTAPPPSSPFSYQRRHIGTLTRFVCPKWSWGLISCFTQMHLSVLCFFLLFSFLFICYFFVCLLVCLFICLLVLFACLFVLLRSNFSVSLFCFSVPVSFCRVFLSVWVLLLLLLLLLYVFLLSACVSVCPSFFHYVFLYFSLFTFCVSLLSKHQYRQPQHQQ